MFHYKGTLCTIWGFDSVKLINYEQEEHNTIVCSTGMDYIRTALSNRPVNPVAPVVVLMPFIGGFSRSLNTASRDMVARGAVVVAAAGNQRDDACLYSPASEPEVTQIMKVMRSNHTPLDGIFEPLYSACRSSQWRQ